MIPHHNHLSKMVLMMDPKEGFTEKLGVLSQLSLLIRNTGTVEAYLDLGLHC